MLAHRGLALGARLAVAVGGEQRRQLGAAAAVLAARQQAAEALAPLGQAAVDLRLAEAGDLADLGVGVARGEQGQRAQLGRLQRLQRLAAAGDLLAPLEALARPGAAGGDPRDRVADPVVAHPQHPLAVAADRQRLVLDHRLRPADQLARPVAGRFDAGGSPAPAGRRPRRRPRRASSGARSASARRPRGRRVRRRRACARLLRYLPAPVQLPRPNMPRRAWDGAGFSPRLDGWTGEKSAQFANCGVYDRAHL